MEEFEMCKNCNMIMEVDFWCCECNSYVISTYDDTCLGCLKNLHDENCYCEERI